MTKFKEYVMNILMEQQLLKKEKLKQNLKGENSPQAIDDENYLNTLKSILHSLPTYFLITNRISIKSEKLLKIGICGLKVEKLNEVSDILKEILKRNRSDNENLIEEDREVEKTTENMTSRELISIRGVNGSNKSIKYRDHFFVNNPENYPHIEFTILKQVMNIIYNI